MKDLFEIVAYGGSSPNVTQDLVPGLVIRNRSTANLEDSSKPVKLIELQQELTRFVKTHSKCGELCPHMQKFYQKIGFFKALENFKYKKMVSIPKVNIGEDRVSKKVLKHLCGSNSIKIWTIKYSSKHRII